MVSSSFPILFLALTLYLNFTPQVSLFTISLCGANSCFSSDVIFQNGALSDADEFAAHDDTDTIYDATSAPGYVSGPISLEDPERVILGAALRNAPYAHFRAPHSQFITSLFASGIPSAGFKYFSSLK